MGALGFGLVYPAPGASLVGWGSGPGMDFLPTLTNAVAVAAGSDHGVALLSVREGLSFETPVVSDAAPLNKLLAPLLDPALQIRCMRDPTRGGVSAALNELADAAGVTAIIDESSVPVSRAVHWACEMLGLDPFHSANEGKAIVFCAAETAGEVLKRLRAHPLGKNAARIGAVVARREAPVIVRTVAGGERILDVPLGEELPRIC
jgi:hydrogenase expression/formation protein HypE